MLHDLQWQTLGKRQAHSKTIMMYRIVHGLIAIPSGRPIFLPSGTTTRGYNLQFLPHCRILAYQHSFFPSGSVLPVESSPSLRSPGGTDLERGSMGVCRGHDPFSVRPSNVQFRTLNQFSSENVIIVCNSTDNVNIKCNLNLISDIVSISCE